MGLEPSKYIVQVYRAVQGGRSRGGWLPQPSGPDPAGGCCDISYKRHFIDHFFRDNFFLCYFFTDFVL